MEIMRAWVATMSQILERRLMHATSVAEITRAWVATMFQILERRLMIVAYAEGTTHHVKIAQGLPTEAPLTRDVVAGKNVDG